MPLIYKGEKTQLRKLPLNSTISGLNSPLSFLLSTSTVLDISRTNLLQKLAFNFPAVLVLMVSVDARGSQISKVLFCMKRWILKECVCFARLPTEELFR